MRHHAMCLAPTRRPVTVMVAAALVLPFVAVSLPGCGDSTTEPTDQADFVRVADDTGPVLGTYFLLSDPDSSAVPDIVPGSVRVWLDDRVFTNNAELGARVAEVWLDPTGRTPAGAPYVGRFHPLELFTDYFLHPVAAYGRTLLALTDGLPADQVLAVSYREVIAAGDTIDVGWVPGDSGTALQLKMLRPNEEIWGTRYLDQSVWAPVRRLELRNVYDLGVRDIDPERFALRLSRDLGNMDPDFTNEFGVTTPLIQVLGLDQRHNDDPSVRSPDGRVDDEFIDYEAGLLFFPDRRPFDPGLADIAGNDFRDRSWPVEKGAARPDTLGWYGVDGNPVRSPAQVRAVEVVPGIYDYRPDHLSRETAKLHVYTIEVSIRL